MARATFIGHLRCEAALAIRRHVLFGLRRLPFGSVRSSILRLTCYFRQCSDESLTARKTANLTHASGGRRTILESAGVDRTAAELHGRLWTPARRSSKPFAGRCLGVLGGFDSHPAARRF